MNVEYDFDKIALLPTELKVLKRMRKHPLAESQIPNYRSMRGSELIFTDDSGKYILSEKATRYLCWHKRQTVKSIVTPVLVSLVTNILLHGITQLLLPTLGLQ